MRLGDGTQLARVLQGWPWWHHSKWRVTNRQHTSRDPRNNLRQTRTRAILACTPTRCPFTPSSAIMRGRLGFRKGVKCAACIGNREVASCQVMTSKWQGRKIKHIKPIFFFHDYFLMLSISLNQCCHFCLVVIPTPVCLPIRQRIINTPYNIC